MKPIPQYVRLRSVVFGDFLLSYPVARMKHGRLWIGSKYGSCGIEVSGRRTLLTIAAMIRRYAR